MTDTFQETHPEWEIVDKPLEIGDYFVKYWDNYKTRCYSDEIKRLAPYDDLIKDFPKIRSG